MKFKKLLFGGLLFTTFSLGALQSQAQVEVGIRAGLNLTNVSSKDGNGNRLDDNNKLKPGFHAGVTFDIPVADEFYLQPGALFSTKGGKVKDEANSVGIGERSSTPYYIEVPVNFLYKPELGSGNLLLGAGPYVAYGVGGRWKAVNTSSNTTTSGPLKFENDVNSVDATRNLGVEGAEVVYGKPLDYGANLLAGYEFSNKLSAQLNAQLGLANIYPTVNNQNTGINTKNVGFGISLGYKF